MKNKDKVESLNANVNSGVNTLENHVIIVFKDKIIADMETPK